MRLVCASKHFKSQFDSAFLYMLFCHVNLVSIFCVAPQLQSSLLIELPCTQPPGSVFAHDCFTFGQVPALFKVAECVTALSGALALPENCQH